MLTSPFLLLVDTAACSDGLDDYGYVVFWIVYLVFLAILVGICKLTYRLLHTLWHRIFPKDT